MSDAGERTFVLDATVIIAYLDANDTHHGWALDLLTENADYAFAASAVNVAEALVHPARAGRLAQAQASLASLDLGVIEIGAGDTESLASLRATTMLRMPDACAVRAAQVTGGTLVTSDRRLASEARGLGLDVLGS